MADARAAAVLVIVSAAPAYAQSVPGTGGDPLRALALDPAVVDNELVPGLAMRGAGPDDTVLLFDDFEVPWAFHDDGVRSIVPPGGAGVELEPGGFGVEHGRGSSIVAMSSKPRRPGFAELTVMDASWHHVGAYSETARVGWPAAIDRFRRPEQEVYLDGVARYEVHLGHRWRLSLSLLGSMEDGRGFAREVTALHHDARSWVATLAVSPLTMNTKTFERHAVDTRAEVLRRADHAIGLTKLEWRLGQQTNSSKYQLAARDFWRHDIAGWTSVAANVSPTIRATAGLRVDDFDGDVATQPRASLTATVARHLELSLAAGAYRRPPEQAAELAQGDLPPERATQIVAGATYGDRRAVRVKAAAYYIDRRRLVAADADGVLHNTGFGSSLGVELGAVVMRRQWLALVSATLARSRRFDFPRAAEHPAAYEQPFKLEVLGVWKHARWTLAARLSLASGLPYTPYTDSVYDADRDTWEPLYAPPLSARTPLHHQLDVRADYAFRLGRVGLAAFLDLHNAYRNRDAIGYSFSYDYRERTAISALPIFPFAGLRASL